MKKITEAQWGELRSAYLAGAGLRSLARRAGIAEGSVLAHAHREGWSASKREALQKAGLLDEGRQSQSRAIVDAVADDHAERAKAHVSRMAQVLETLGGHLAGMDAEAVWDGITKVDVFDKVCRRNFGLDVGERAVIVNVLASGGYDFTPANAESFV